MELPECIGSEQVVLAEARDGVVHSRHVAGGGHIEAAHLGHVRKGVQKLGRARDWARARKRAGLKRHRLQHRHVRVDVLLEESGVLLACFHLKGELRDLGRAPVDLHAKEILLQDERRYILGQVTLFLVDLEQHVERVHQNVPASARRVAQRQVLGRVHLDKVLGLALGRYVVVHLSRQGTVGVVEHP